MFVQLFEHRHKVLLTRLSGTFNADDIAALYAAAERFIAREGPALRSLQDFSAVDAVDVPIQRIAQHGWRAQIVPGGQRILVVPQPEFQDMALMFAAYQQVAGYAAPLILRSLKDAYEQLGLTRPRFEPVP